ncbi:MAG: RES family NAD+ phosphorylase [Longimicrobiales bacterium]
MDVPLRRIDWQPCYRIVPSRFPPVSLFERVAAPEDFDALYEVEAMTNDRLRDEVGEITRVAPEERVLGPGASYIMAPFTHLAPFGGRFTDGTYGAYYAALERATAVAETRYHRERFLSYTSEPPMQLEMRVLEAHLEVELHDVRGLWTARPELYRPDDYTASQLFGRALRDAASWGIAYDSVRWAGGECAAVFRPRALSDCRQAEHLVYVWDGERIVEVYEKRLYRP